MENGERDLSSGLGVDVDDIRVEEDERHGPHGGSSQKRGGPGMHASHGPRETAWLDPAGSRARGRTQDRAQSSLISTYNKWANRVSNVPCPVAVRFRLRSSWCLFPPCLSAPPLCPFPRACVSDYPPPWRAPPATNTRERRTRSIEGPLCCCAYWPVVWYCG